MDSDSTDGANQPICATRSHLKRHICTDLGQVCFLLSYRKKRNH